jgi:hydroxyacylglutathione hydrolase
MKIKAIYANNSLRNISYLLINQHAQAICIDPYNADQIASIILRSGLKLTSILNTHQHHDHIKGNNKLSSIFQTSIETYHGGEVINLDSQLKIKVLKTPGHTLEHVSFLAQDTCEKALFAGDTIFNCGVGNCKNGGDVGTLFETISGVFMQIDDDTILYPGHDYIENNLNFCLSFWRSNDHLTELKNRIKGGGQFTNYFHSMKIEKLVNPFFQLNNVNLRRDLAFDDAFSDKDLFIYLRAQRDIW